MNIVITLLYADWCGFCKKFKPEWNMLSDIIKNRENDTTYKELLKAGYKIKLQQFNDQQLDSLLTNKLFTKSLDIDPNKIGFPTLIVQYGDTLKKTKLKNSNEVRFYHLANGQSRRLDTGNAKDILESLKNINNKQKGGAVQLNLFRLNKDDIAIKSLFDL
uniref:Thioredoxin domain-containing protein n=1 Tax=viral metagenome TaxID=1070528 RepID=A0A6C0E9P8_9ZZZZ